MGEIRGIVERLRACENDPMWADHAEIPKFWCKEAADEIERLSARLDGAKLAVDVLTSQIERHEKVCCGEAREPAPARGGEG